MSVLIVVTAHAISGAEDGNTIRLVAGEVPPYIDRNGSGREADIIRAAFRKASPGKKIVFFVLPFSRHWEAYHRDTRYDGVITIPDGIHLDGVASPTYIEYQNEAIYLHKLGSAYSATDTSPNKNPGLRILTGRRVVGFAGAAGILRLNTSIIQTFKSYSEYENQFILSRLLVSGGADFILAEPSVTDYYNHLALGAKYGLIYGEIHSIPIFCASRYHIVFRSEAYAKPFRDGLKAITADGELRSINEHYEHLASVHEDYLPVKVCLQ